MSLRLKGKQYLAQCVQDLVKLKTFEKLLGTLDDFEIHLGLPIHVGTVTKPSSFVPLFKHSIDMLQFSKGLIRIKSTNFIDCLLCAINNIESHSFSISQLGSLCWSVIMEIPSQTKSEWVPGPSEIRILLHQPFLFIASAIVEFHSVSGA